MRVRASHFLSAFPFRGRLRADSHSNEMRLGIIDAWARHQRHASERLDQLQSNNDSQWLTQECLTRFATDRTAFPVCTCGHLHGFSHLT
jgi:hypothetical protein